MVIYSCSECNIFLLFRIELIIAVKSALQLVVKGREKYFDLNVHFCNMIELFLTLREKCFVSYASDDEITSLIHKEWQLHDFIQELIQALLPQKTFGGYRNQFLKEIKVHKLQTYNVNCALFCIMCIHISYIRINFEGQFLVDS